MISNSTPKSERERRSSIAAIPTLRPAWFMISLTARWKVASFISLPLLPSLPLASKGKGDMLLKRQQSSSNNNKNDMLSKPEESSSNEENDGNEDRDSGNGGLLYEDSVKSRFICLASSKEFMMKVDCGWCTDQSKIMSLVEKIFYCWHSQMSCQHLIAVRWLECPRNNNTYIRKTNVRTNLTGIIY